MEGSIFKETGLAVIKGELFSILINTIGLILLALLMTYSAIAETAIPILVIAINTISIFIGTSIATVKLQKNGILNGILIGIIYIVIYFIISLVTGNINTLNPRLILLVILGIIAGAVGGIIGINFHKNN